MKKVIINTLFLLLIAGNAYGNMIAPERGGNTTVFFSQTDQAGTDAVVRGVVSSFSFREIPDKKKLHDQIQDKTKVTVRLYSSNGIKTGDVMYIIDRDNLVVSRIDIRHIFKSHSFGPMLIGYGNFKLARVGYRVVYKKIDESSQYAYINASRGHYFSHIGDKGRAIAEYKKAIQRDNGNPTAHLYLGLEYKKQEMLQYAFREFSLAYTQLSRLYSKEDRFLLLSNMAEIRFNEVYNKYLPVKIRKKYRAEALQYCTRALKILPDAPEINYFLGVLEYKTASPDDKKAKNYFLKVIEKNPSHVNSYVALSELYYKHKNKEKARLYAEKALSYDPASKRARELIKYIDTSNP